MTVSTPLTVWPTTAAVLRDVFSIDSGPKLCCHGVTTKQKRCRIGVSKANSALVSELLEQAVLKGSWKAALSILTKLARLIMCQTFHQDHGDKWLLKWQKKLESTQQASPTEVQNQRKPSKGHAKDVKAVQAAPQLLQVPSTPKIKVEDDSGLEDEALVDTLMLDAKPHRRRSSSDSSILASPSSTALRAAGPKHTLEPFGLPRTTIKTNRTIKRLLLRDLTKKEHRPGSSTRGYIYIYSFPTNYRDLHPYLKIGYTSDIDRRKGDWRRKCGYTPEVLGEYPAEVYIKVEKLVHAQLWNARMREPECPGCKGKHIEWFDIEVWKASAAVSMWAQWMRFEPYDKEGKLREGWRLRLEELDLSDAHCWEKFVDVKEDKENGSGTESESDSESDGSDYETESDSD